MDLLKFWTLAEKHPWLPSIMMPHCTDLKRALSLDEPHPEAIVFHFGKSTIEDRIGYIAFRPWEKIDLNAPGYERYSRTTDMDVFNQRVYSVYFHKYKDVPFTSSISVGKDKPDNVSDLIKAVPSTHVIDAVVKWSFYCRSRASVATAILDILETGKTDHGSKSSFDIYLNN